MQQAIIAILGAMGCQGSCQQSVSYGVHECSSPGQKALGHPESALWQRLHSEFVTQNPCFLTSNCFIYSVKTQNSNKVTSARLLSDRAAKLLDVSHVPG